MKEVGKKKFCLPTYMYEERVNRSNMDLCSKCSIILCRKQDFNSSMCNAKLIGAKSFYMGLIANESNFKIRMNSTREMEGRGTLVSSIVARNYVESAQEIDTQIRNSQRKPLPNLKITQTQQL